MIAKLFIKGIKEPIEVTEEQGKKAERIKKGEGEFAGLSDKDTVSIEGAWTGEKVDLRYVRFQKEGGQKKEADYSSAELLEFEHEIEPYFVTEKDDEYNKCVANFIRYIKDVDSKIFLGKVTENMLLAVRKDISTFPSLAEWKEKRNDEKQRNETDEEFIVRVNGDYEKENNNSLKKELEQNEDKVNEGAEKVVKNRVVGTLRESGRNRYLIDKKAIKINNDGVLTILQYADGSIPFSGLNHKLSKYLEWKAKKEYANNKQAEGYEEMEEEEVVNDIDF